MPSSFFSNLKFLAVAGVGLFGDGYLNITIGLVVPMLGYIYFADEKGKVPTVQSDVIKGCLSVGMVVGQLFFGLFGDALGRHRIYGKELIVTIFGTFMVILLPWGAGFSHQSVVAWMAVFRVVTGMGIGGDYPMTSAISAEHNPMGSRAKLVLTVFSCIGLGGFCAGIVYIVLLSALKSSVEHNIYHLQWVWRLLFGIGLIPLMLTLYARLTMRESNPYGQYVAKDTSLMDKNKRGVSQQLRDFREYFSQWKHAKVLFATSMSWFLFDIAFYGVNLNQSIILSKIGYGVGSTKWETLFNTAVGNVIVLAAGYLPGYYIGIFLPDLIGRVRQQFLGSVIVAVLYAIWAGVSHSTSTGGLITLFTLSQLFLNMGPNATTFLLPTEVFPTRVRGTAHGISAASGKCGAILTAFAFGSVTDAIGLQGVLGLFAGIMVLCAAVTLLIPETKGTTIEDIERDVIYGQRVPKDSSASAAGKGLSPSSTLSTMFVEGKHGMLSDQKGSGLVQNLRRDSAKCRSTGVVF